MESAMITGEPITEVMQRTGRGTAATNEAGHTVPLAWGAAQERFRKGGWFWLSTVRPSRRPHVMPCFAAWSESSFFVASKASARKTRNLDADGRCVLTTDAGDAHLIVEGRASRVLDQATLERAAAAFKAVYDWPTTPSGEELDADYGAPTSGGPPYRVYEITPTLAFGFPTDGERFAPTRWRFRGHHEPSA
jgi:Pyridoxamine 5'-phosphate oxidase